MAKMYQVDKMAIMATMAKMAFQLGTLLNHEYKVNQIESIKMGMSRKIVLKNAADLPRINLIVWRGRFVALSGQKKTPCKQLARGLKGVESWLLRYGHCVTFFTFFLHCDQFSN